MGFEHHLKTIVVATDLEGHSEAALEYARKIASAYGARIVLSYGLDPLDYAAVDTVPSPLLRQLPEQARAVLNKMSEELAREGIHSHSEVRQGTVVRTLLDVAKQYGAGLIVVGIGQPGSWTGGCRCNRRRVGASCPLSGVGGGGGLERRCIPPGPGWSHLTGHGTE